jgi:lambda family phage portal protein
MLSVHRAAEQNRFTNDWIAPATSADSSIVPDLARVNARSRQLVRDDPWARSIVRGFRRNVIGTGITPSVDNQPYKRAWERWSTNPAMMDMERRRTFLMVQQWAMDEVVTVGECFVVRWIVGQGTNRRLVLQCFEFEQLDQYKIGNGQTGNEIRHGIEVDANGAAVAFHFYKHHPNDIRGLARPAPMTLDSMRVPAEMVCHIYDPERVRQTHGISRLAPVLRKIRDLTEYDAAQLRAARAEASIGLLINGGDDSEEPLQLDGLNVAYLSEDEKVTQFTPQRPGNVYDPFVIAQLKAIAAGVGLSYPLIARDFSGGSFGSQRQNSIEDRREFGPLERMLITQLCDPTMNDYVFVWSMQNPELSGDYFLTDESDPINWQGQGHEWVDPEQQGKGVLRQMQLGLTTRTREASKLGTTVEELDREMQQDGTREVVAQTQSDGRENPKPEQPNLPFDEIDAPSAEGVSGAV